MPTADPQLSARLYRESRDRIVGLVAGLDDAAWHTAVPACPGWSVRDVVAHVTAVVQEWCDGRLTGAPTDEQTAAQIARFADHDAIEIIGAWATATGELIELAQTRGLVAPVGDIVSHEHDIRGALARPGARDSAAVRYSSDQLLAMLQTPVPLRVIVEDGEYRSGPSDGREWELRTHRFEALRWRTGRRSRAQLAAMAWSADPAPVLDALYLFGPADTDIVE
ncbi:maleylpyruvate isomerase N-terminal domain-containing protein [Mycolicibacterium sp. S2-37]|uniref:maleylpyruvate isomerase N-terminal domain-containing protein n=1 Tax=Mycolicibacterium sp. S2-37 TaxID=2810297 RepID=UPI001A94C70F|nr:maleylpyruvate isomerase N-terminal domain-containing protein [Mycolicibacterium sp. S2-37]MBO0677896.1 maleylpyruvate isomerase N-terminal domain-containing protein [Mycolicibacterium sp. S2-37]